MRRKTYTSPEVKNRWNDRHYDKVIITVPKGAREEIKKVAAAHGLSVAAYVRTLIIKDTAENPETTPFLGGGVVNSWNKFIKIAGLEKEE